MFDSSVLDVVVGLSFVFLIVSLISSAIVEVVSGIMKWRSATLFRGVRDLLNDQQLTGLARQLYQHALVNPRNPGTSTTAEDLSAGMMTRLWHGIAAQGASDLTHNAPSYIDPKQFAAAFLDILDHGPAPMINSNPASIAAAIDAAAPAASNPQINAMLHGMLRRTGGDLEHMRQELATWFDNSMDRISGSYKRWSQRLGFWVALIICILLNISAIHVAKSLWQQPIDTKILVNVTRSQPPPPVDVALETLEGLQLPIGWAHYKRGDLELEHLDLVEIVAGWIITAFASVFGAPFWFDMLQVFVRLKSSGPSPREKDENTAAAA